jgi:hypothetical protein
MRPHDEEASGPPPHTWKAAASRAALLAPGRLLGFVGMKEGVGLSSPFGALAPD